MELYHLKTFVTVAEEGHLTRASERLFTSQPAISAHIKALEEELGITLFNRTPKGMQLTAEGEALMDRARSALSGVNEFVQQARSLQNEVVGTLRVGLNNEATFLRLPELQKSISDRHGQLALHYVSGATGAHIPSVRVGKLDAAFISGGCKDPQITSVFLSDIPLSVAVPIDWRERVEGKSADELAQLPWVYTTPDCAHFAAMRAVFAERGLQPAKTVIADQEDAMIAMVRAGIGMSVVREDQALAAEQEGYAFVLPMALPSVSLDFIYLKRRSGDPAIQALLNELLRIWEVPEPRDTSQQEAG